jgi:hypothetical protein
LPTAFNFRQTFKHKNPANCGIAIKPIVDRLIEISTDHIDILPIETILKQPQFSGDGLAKRWRLNEDLHLCTQALLPYQTRIYAQGRRSL